MLGFAVGIIASNAFEWLIHRHVLHGVGKKKGSFWSFHFHEHHRNVRKNGGFDPLYEEPFWKAPSKSKEALGVLGMAAVVTPLLPVAPYFVAAAWLNSGAYYYLHKKAHLDPEWARRWLPWHVDHHLGPNQEANWCVTWPMMDWLMNTRRPWVNTEAERKSRAGDRTHRPTETRFTAGATPRAVAG